MAENRLVYVVDASIILKWILTEEEYSKNAEALGDQAAAKKCNLFVPDHTYTEVANILAIKGKTDVGAKLKMIFDKGFLVTIWHTVAVTELAVGIMKKHKGVSFYDAVYHALALHVDGTFITADEKYYRQTKALGNSMLLKDYPIK